MKKIFFLSVDFWKERIMEKHKKSLHDDDITRDGSFERKASTFRNWISKGAHKYKTIFTNYIIK